MRLASRDLILPHRQFVGFANRSCMSPSMPASLLLFPSLLHQQEVVPGRNVSEILMSILNLPTILLRKTSYPKLGHDFKVPFSLGWISDAKALIYS